MQRNRQFYDTSALVNQFRQTLAKEKLYARLTVSLTGDYGGFVLQATVTSDKSQYLYSATLMRLDEIEQYLNAGRFRLYHGNHLSNMIASGHLIFSDPISQFETLVTWINENTDSKWSVRIVPHHVGKFECLFHFEDEVDAVHFALRWR